MKRCTLGAYLIIALLPWASGNAVALPSQSYELGVAGVSGGDDHADPAGLVRVAIGSSHYGQMLLYGADFGPVRARNVLISGGFHHALKGLDRVEMQFGLTLMDEYIGIYNSTRKRADNTDQPKISEHNFNIGGMLGLRLNLMQKSRYTANLGWESHLFLAGSAAIYLVTGVKQAWYASVGVSI
ncbi:MAG: hypothetical protein FJ146_13820 [Deltaproteobacteria bacterium]|nr:hypothetical protein [Deltaproteobacteria bacterium]